MTVFVAERMDDWGGSDVELFASLDSAVAGVRGDRAEYEVVWAGPTQTDANTWRMVGEYPYIPNRCVKHTAIWLISERDVR